MKPLSIKDALKLYRLIGKYLPEVSDTTTGMDFIGKIIENIKIYSHPRDYIEAIALMMNTTVEDIVTNLKSDEVLQMFIEGLEINQILFLQEFCKKVGFNG